MLQNSVFQSFYLSVCFVRYQIGQAMFETPVRLIHGLCDLVLRRQKPACTPLPTVRNGDCHVKPGSRSLTRRGCFRRRPYRTFHGWEVAQYSPQSPVIPSPLTPLFCMPKMPFLEKAMERVIKEVIKKSRVINEDPRKKSRVQDIIKSITSKNWR